MLSRYILIVIVSLQNVGLNVLLTSLGFQHFRSAFI